MKTKVVTSFCIIMALLSVMSFTSFPKDKMSGQDGYRLVFSDEFNQPDGSQPDPKKWVRSKRNASRWARWISDSRKTVFIKNGRLVCRAIPNDNLQSDTATMLTGAIETRGLFEMKYGKVEVRMRTNVKSGNFPAAWLRNDPATTSNLYSEIDIMESFGKSKEAVHTVHSELTTKNRNHGEKNQFRYKTDITKWHVYGVTWTPQEIVWTVDGKETGRYRKSKSVKKLAMHQWTFDMPLFIRLNQSVYDGTMGLYPDTKATYTTEFDWIRVYQFSDR